MMIGLAWAPGCGDRAWDAAGAGEWFPFPHLNCPVQGAWAAQKGHIPLLFVGEERVWSFDRLGLPGQWEGGRPGSLGDWGPELWAAETARQARLGRHVLRRVGVAVPGNKPEDLALRLVLEAAGCRVEDQWRRGVPAFFAHRGGFHLTAQDERGALIDGGQLLTLVTLIEMENGSGLVVLPPGRSVAAELVAAGYGGRVLPLEAPRGREMYAQRPWLWSAPSSAARICARMALSGQRLDALLSKTPRFHGWRRQVPLTGEGAEVLSALAGERGAAREGEGLRLRTGGAWVHLRPRGDGVRVLVEGPDLEIAAELCDLFAERVREVDRELR